MTVEANLKPEQSELGKKSQYDSVYNPEKLFPIARKKNRETLGILSHTLPFYGFDYWNHYEVSWLNKKGKPIVALAEIVYSCDSLNIIESKSMKLYFNSFNNSQFDCEQEVEDIIIKDFAQRLQGSIISVKIIPLCVVPAANLLPRLQGLYLDELDISCSVYHTDPSLLTTENKWVSETLCTDLLKSNCLVTNQPDWCSVQITYTGKKINHEGLLRYIVSFRNDNEFHEHCIEKIFMHILQYCKPSELTVYGRSTRRGGIDINSIRSTHPIQQQKIVNERLCRQ